MVLVEESVPTQVNVVNLCQLAKPNPLTTDIVLRVFTPGTDSHEEKNQPWTNERKSYFSRSECYTPGPDSPEAIEYLFITYKPWKIEHFKFNYSIEALLFCKNIYICAQETAWAVHIFIATYSVLESLLAQSRTFTLKTRQVVWMMKPTSWKNVTPGTR